MSSEYMQYILIGVSIPIMLYTFVLAGQVHKEEKEARRLYRISNEISIDMLLKLKKNYSCFERLFLFDDFFDD